MICGLLSQVLSKYVLMMLLISKIEHNSVPLEKEHLYLRKFHTQLTFPKQMIEYRYVYLEIKEWLSLRTIQAKLFASADMVSELGLLLAVAF